MEFKQKITKLSQMIIIIMIMIISIVIIAPSKVAAYYDRDGGREIFSDDRRNAKQLACSRAI